MKFSNDTDLVDLCAEVYAGVVTKQNSRKTRRGLSKMMIGRMTAQQQNCTKPWRGAELLRRRCVATWTGSSPRSTLDPRVIGPPEPVTEFRTHIHSRLTPARTAYPGLQLHCVLTAKILTSSSIAASVTYADRKATARRRCARELKAQRNLM